MTPPPTSPSCRHERARARQPRRQGSRTPATRAALARGGASGGCSARTRRNGGDGLEWGHVQHLFYVLGELESFSADANHRLAAHGLHALARWLHTAVGTTAAVAVRRHPGRSTSSISASPTACSGSMARGAGECVDEVEAVEGVTAAEEGEEGGVTGDRVGGEGCRDDELGAGAEEEERRDAGAKEEEGEEQVAPELARGGEDSARRRNGGGSSVA
uniref:Uncharacterized protein n=1 Tax=Oryza meridionalis TaxID=40149 RepID=A0A0E0EM98_9ORYZ